ncbi:conserved hypothetical protein [Sphingomonas sp. EC-HK361]|uniref:MliC family protein n=1 Tax=Sphingomonas sp. EC-HK361 TaxID=2038397 RepID=UPI0012528F4F|nr:MliC family protein [Sphingomonas sp. EC-HK361]VVT02155.1 conserved hypothetical protein [Sphingomonas sp. EC-HK361]
MKLLWTTPFALLAACGQPAPGNDTVVADNATTTATTENGTTVAIDEPDAAPTETPVTAPPTPAAIPSPPPETVSEAPFTDDSAQGAANVVQTYFALIEAGKYRQAWALWRDGGKGSGMSAPAFAQSFAKYAEYHAEVGAPGRIDAGAGQRYVTVPVKTYGTLKTGKPFAMDGDVTLHRTGDIDGATAEQKSWRINTSDLKPRPADAASGDGRPANAVARYACEDGSRFVARFDNRAGTVTLNRGGKPFATLTQQRAASGIWYRGDGFELRGKGNAATLTGPGGKSRACTA